MSGFSDGFSAGFGEPEAPETPIEWYQPLTEPVLVKSRASEFPAFAVDAEGLTLPEVTSLDRWFRKLDEPVLPRVLPISNYPFTFFLEEVSDPDLSTEWYVPFSEVLHKDGRSEAVLLVGSNYEGEPSDVEPVTEVDAGSILQPSPHWDRRFAVA